MENKNTKGRQKIEMKKIEDEAHRLVSFSKRRSGIYKKASELRILCGVEVAFFVFSPSGKPYTFATSSIHSVMDMFINRPLPPSNDTNHLLEARQSFRINELRNQYNALVARLEAGKEQVVTLKRMTRARQVKGWWEENIDELSLSELEQMEKSIGDCQKEISPHVNDLNTSVSPSSMFRSSTAPNSSQMNHQGLPR